MGVNSTRKPAINRTIAFWGGLFLSTIAVALIALSVWFILSNHDDYELILLEEPPVFIEHTAITVFYMAPFAYLGLLIIGIVCAAIGVRGESLSIRVYEKVNKVAGVLVLLGVLGMFLGSYLANIFWAEQFQKHGYVECSSSFTITSKWFKTVWVDSPMLCADESVRDMFRSHEYDLTDINAYVSKRRL
ncbi:hypothetical protein [Marinobacter sp.]|uniref:hypothetical protein n=1 Tax=Marinobacter sp. TaxID=50741 RepID=UPI003A90E28B